jgi:hypothetical protein
MPEVVISPKSAEQNPKLFMHIMETCTRFRLLGRSAALIEQFSSAIQRNPKVASIVILISESMSKLDSKRATLICDILRLNLPNLTFLGLSLDVPLDAQVCTDLFQALQDTSSPLKTLDLGWSRLGDAGGSAVCSALRSSSTVRKLVLMGCQLSSGCQHDLIDFIKFNTPVRCLNLGLNRLDLVDAAGAEALSQALEMNTTLQVLDFSSTWVPLIAPIFSGLRSNKSLRSLKLEQCGLLGDDMSFIFDCLCNNKGLQRLDITLSHCKDAPVVLQRFFRTNQTLKRLYFQMDDMETVDFAPMFDGLAYNTVLTNLGFSYVSPKFVEQLSDCIKNRPTSALPLQDLNIGYSDMGESALNLIEAIHRLPTLRKLDISMCPLGPRSVEALANLIESNATLQNIQLYRSQLTDEHALRLIEALRKNSTLLEFGMGGNPHEAPVFEALCDYIATNRTLEWMFLSDSVIPTELRPRFEAALLKNPKMSRLDCTFGNGKLQIGLNLKEELQRLSYTTDSANVI